MGFKFMDLEKKEPMCISTDFLYGKAQKVLAQRGIPIIL